MHILCDTTVILRLTGGTINEGFYLDDLHHLTYKGLVKVTKKLELRPAQTDIGYNVVSNHKSRHSTSRGQDRKQDKRKQTRTTSSESETTQRWLSGLRPSDEMSNETTYRRRDDRPTAYRRSDEMFNDTTYRRRLKETEEQHYQSLGRSTKTIRCRYCAEPNQREDRCHHQGPI